ncbi:MAG: hypothetical protein U0236_11000 [Nitrospira sp.]
MSNENQVGMKPLIVFYAGVGAVAVIIGLLTGLSSSPVVGILMPLVFSVLTAGGTVYAHLVKMSEANKTSLLSSTVSPQTLGKQLLCFSIGFLLGLWLGVQAKLTPSLLWHSGSARIPAYDSSTIAFQDTRLLAAAMKLDSDIDSKRTRPCKKGGNLKIDK